MSEGSAPAEAATGSRWPRGLKISSILGGVAVVIGLIADVDSLIGIPAVAVAAFFLCLGIAACGLGALNYGRHWGQPTGWPTTRAVGIFTAGVITVTLSLHSLAPDLIDRLPGSNPATRGMAWHGTAELTISGLDLDVTPPVSSGEIDIYSEDYGIVSLDPAQLEPWDSNFATGAECTKHVDESLEHNMPYVVTGSTGCVKTSEGKIAFIRVAATSRQTYRLEITLFR